MPFSWETTTDQGQQPDSIPSNVPPPITGGFSWEAKQSTQSTDIPDMTAVYNTPWTDSARNIIKNSKITFSDQFPSGIGGKNDKGVITIARGSSPSIINHELLHSFFQNSKIDPNTFNSDFTKAMREDPELVKIDQNLNSSHYNKSDLYSLANERFAYMGEVMGNDGLSNIPKSLQKYYSPYLNDGEPQKTSGSSFADKYEAFSNRIGQLGGEMNVGIVKSVGGILGGLQSVNNWLMTPLNKAMEAVTGKSASPDYDINKAFSDFSDTMDKHTGVQDKNYLEFDDI